MKSHPKTHEADIMVGEGLHGLHPAHKVPAFSTATESKGSGKAHNKTHEDDVRVGEGLNGVHPSHIKLTIHPAFKESKLNTAGQLRETSDGGRKGMHDPKDKTLRK